MYKQPYKSFSKEPENRGTKGFRLITQAQNKRIRKTNRLLLAQRLQDEEVELNFIVKSIDLL